jgi:hypothetical protein
LLRFCFSCLAEPVSEPAVVSVDLSTIENRLDLLCTVVIYFFAFVIVGFVIYLLYQAVNKFTTF